MKTEIGPSLRRQQYCLFCLYLCSDVHIHNCRKAELYKTYSSYVSTTALTNTSSQG